LPNFLAPAHRNFTFIIAPTPELIHPLDSFRGDDRNIYLLHLQCCPQRLMKFYLVDFYLKTESVTAIKDFGIQLQVRYLFGAEDLMVLIILFF
jgi:hypothetical protein